MAVSMGGSEEMKSWPKESIEAQLQELTTTMKSATAKMKSGGGMIEFESMSTIFPKVQSLIVSVKQGSPTTEERMKLLQKMMNAYEELSTLQSQKFTELNRAIGDMARKVEE